MNEKLQYATMLEIPVNTCNVTYKPSKKRKKAKRKADNPETVKEELLLKVNSESEKSENLSDIADTVDAVSVSEPLNENLANAETVAEIPTETESEEYVSTSVRKKARKPLFKFSAVTAEIIAVFALVAVIFLTNAFYRDSAINVFMRRVFSPTVTETAAEKTYRDFAPVVNFNGDMTMENGVISCTGSGAVYAPSDGVVSSVVAEEDGTYTICVAHSGLFSSKISGLSYAYLGTGDSVYGNIPVGYVKDGGFTMCFNSEDAVITDYTIENNTVLWAV